MFKHKEAPIKLYNPTPEQILSKHNGKSFYIDPGHYIDVTDETGKWILDKDAFLGVVHIDLQVGDKKKDIQSIVVEKTVVGLQRYIDHLHTIIESYMSLDNELKQINHAGTVMTRPGCKKANRYLEIATRMLKDVESKYGVSIASKELEEKTQTLHASIDTMIAQFEGDVAAKEQVKKDEQEANKLLKSVLPQEIFKRESVA